MSEAVSEVNSVSFFKNTSSKSGNIDKVFCSLGANSAVISASSFLFSHKL
jgi:hypothetical protein